MNVLPPLLCQAWRSNLGLCVKSQHVGPSFLVSLDSLYRSFKALHRSCIRASNDQEVIIAPGIHCDLDFADHLSATDHTLVVEVTALFWG